ncbi:glycoside hydrolase family 88 protein [Vibrio natriegens]|jgi:unsaturated chondroitin disaccharide hydrolase|uniref:glycoside hydrolase family 88 protein n=1 Tax=Vibrio TaxID=662 RepID=UPI000803DF53|nr:MULTISPECIES: glycoside hydrolase family 88 protein [Vibrio]ANQ18609.1 glycosyl hydrolase [Vibrio natriegens]MCG9698745.1 glycoside hydrolase family 88 protein [Vibrio natriegens]MDV6251962.1 glycoside hydrolase family 88 protein [Vibrio sp. EA2]CAH0532112.1 Unsaturated glucuronyl hydrolase [Catenococcus thiocycli]
MSETITLRPLPGTLDETKVVNHLTTVVEAIKRNIPKIGERNPKIGTSEHQWDYCDQFDWVSSFWTGELWLCYQMTADQQFKNSAKLRKQYFADMLLDPFWLDHDLGFQYSLSCVADYKLTGDEESKMMAIRAADHLIHRFRKIGGYIVAWNDTHPLGPEITQGKSIIDSLQNTALLFWASKVTGSPVYAQAATRHSETLAKHIVREDYSTYHSFNFHPVTQEPIKGETFQGYADDSCWARGQSWAIHGFAQTYLYTQDEKFLTLAKKLARYAVEQITDDGVPVWDYSLPSDEIQYKDSSAGAITAAGLLLISQCIQDPEEAKQYRDWGNFLLQGLMNSCDLTGDESALGLLAHGASFVKVGLCDNMLPYGDYYYLEALMRANGYQKFFW